MPWVVAVHLCANIQEPDAHAKTALVTVTLTMRRRLRAAFFIRATERRRNPWHVSATLRF
jgi:hypothetical protein